MRLYSVWGGPDSDTPSLMVSRSDDGGATWKTPVVAVTVTLAGGITEGFSSNSACAALAIDAGDPDVLYVYSRIGHENDLGDTAARGSGGVTSFVSVSTDGAATFKTMVLQVGGTAGGPHGGWDQVGICGDIISPAANAVVVESPGGYNGDGNPDIAIWADAARGAGFAGGTSKDSDYLADGFTDALDNLIGNHDIDVAQNGGTDDAGGITESPRLLTDGAGRVCLTYYGTTTDSNGDTQSHAYVQCSADMAHTFSAPLAVDAEPLNQAISSPAAALGPGGQAAVLWNDATGKHLLIATSTDGGRTFGPPSMVPLYQSPDGTDEPFNPSVAYDAAGVLWISYVEDLFGLHLVVDKSCDNGHTWSGSVLVNGPEGSTADMQFPAFALTPTAAPGLVATAAAGHLAYFTLAP
jgi:hypothetical protein